jgi:hypothetical protein
VPPPLPVASKDWKRFTKTQRTLNDHVEEVHKALLDSDQGEQYRAFLFAVYDEQAVEGSLAADNVLSAKMIREWAEKEENQELTREKPATIAKALGVVLRRYHESRKERRQMVDGEIIEGNNGD